MQHEFRNNIWMLCVVGFVVGILYSNCIAKEYMLSLAIFDNYYLNQFVQTNRKDISFILYLIKIRMLPFVVMCIFQTNRLGKIIIWIFLFWTGFLFGIVFTAGALKVGIKGIVLSLLMLFPHGIAYFFGYGMLIHYVGNYNKRFIEYNKLIICIAYICVGIILEYYINPIMVKIFIKMI